jgi:glycosyltransferase involved in cell wall biosynthesis
LAIDRRRALNPLTPFAKLLPRSLVTAGWRADLQPWLQTWRPDIVHFHNPHPPGALVAAARICTNFDIPYVLSTHGFVEFDDLAKGMNTSAWKAVFFRRLIRAPVAGVARRAARVLMLSPDEEPILRSMGVMPDRLTVATNGVDPYFQTIVDPEERSRLVARFNLPVGMPLMLYVGNHTPNKGIDVLLRALDHMVEPGVAVIGGAIRSRQEHQALLAGCGIPNGNPRALFTDFISKEELRALYQSVDIFVFPSRADTLPLVILEAMASGLPVVSTRVGGIPYEVAPDTGILVESGDSVALAEALDRLCANAERRRAMGRAGSCRVAEMFNWNASAAKVVEVYRDITGIR